MKLLTRRELIVTGSAGAALLALSSCVKPKAPANPHFDDPNHAYAFLNGADREVVAAVAAAMLAGALPAGSARHDALIAVNRGVDVAVSSLPPGMREEVRQLFALLSFPPARALAAGIWSAWSDAEPATVAAFLERWRLSGAALFRSGYQALHQLIMAAWYGQTRSWPRIGYPGPPVLP